MEGNRKERLYGIDFIRAVCALGIIAFHFSCHTASSIRPFYIFANGDFGGLFVAVFFVISGMTLYYNHPKAGNLKDFYLKRAKTIYPPFYIAYIVFFIKSVIDSKNFFWGGNPAKLLLTAAGMDGYLAYRVQGYYILGEWFLGAIILLYLLYPVVAAGFNKSVIASSAIVLAGYIFACAATFFVIPLEENLFACLASFFIGMLIAKYKKQILDNKWLVIPCAAICAVLFFVRIPAGSIEMSRINNSICIHIMGPSLFICLYHAGCLINKCKAAGSVISFMGKLSYPVFLLQHRLILEVLVRKNPDSSVKAYIALLFITLLTFAAGWVLSELLKLPEKIRRKSSKKK